MAEERPRGRRGSNGGERRGRRRAGGTATTDPSPASDTAVVDETSTTTVVDLNSLYKMSNQDLGVVAKGLEISGASSMRKQELIFEIMKAQSEKERAGFRRGRAPDPAGRLRVPAPPRLQLPSRSRRHLRLPVADQAFRPDHRRHRFRAGPPAQADENYFALIKVLAVNFDDPDRIERAHPVRQPDTALPRRASWLETEPTNLSGRIMDLLTPIGKGQRGLIVGTRRAPARRCCCSRWPTRSPPTIPRCS